MTAENGFISELRRAYQGQLHSYLTQMVGSPNIALELAQENLEHVHRTYRREQVMFSASHAL